MSCLVDSFIADTNVTATNLVHTFALTLIFGSHIYPFGYGVGIWRLTRHSKSTFFGEQGQFWRGQKDEKRNKQRKECRK